MERFRKCREALLLAHDEDAIERLVQDCMAQLGPDEIGALPKVCKQVMIGRPRDIHEAAVTLLQAELALDHESPGRVILREIAHVYAAASVRLSKL